MKVSHRNDEHRAWNFSGCCRRSPDRARSAKSGAAFAAGSDPGFRFALSGLREQRQAAATRPLPQGEVGYCASAPAHCAASFPIRMSKSHTSAISRAKRPEVCGRHPLEDCEGKRSAGEALLGGCRSPFRGCGASLQQGRRLPALRHGISRQTLSAASTRAARRPLPLKAGGLAKLLAPRSSCREGGAPGRPGASYKLARRDRPLAAQRCVSGRHPLAPR